MSDPAQTNPFTQAIGNIDQLKNNLDIGKTMIENWELLDKVGAVKGISKEKMQRIQGHLEALYNELISTEEQPKVG